MLLAAMCVGCGDAVNLEGNKVADARAIAMAGLPYVLERAEPDMLEQGFTRVQVRESTLGRVFAFHAPESGTLTSPGDVASSRLAGLLAVVEIDGKMVAEFEYLDTESYDPESISYGVLGPANGLSYFRSLAEAERLLRSVLGMQTRVAFVRYASYDLAIGENPDDETAVVLVSAATMDGPEFETGRIYSGARGIELLESVLPVSIRR